MLVACLFVVDTSREKIYSGYKIHSWLLPLT